MSTVRSPSISSCASWVTGGSDRPRLVALRRDRAGLFLRAGAAPPGRAQPCQQYDHPLSAAAPAGLPADLIDLDWSRCAVTALGYSFEQVPLHRAAHNHVNSTITLYQQLRQLGYRRI